MQIPIIKKDASVQVSLNFNTISALVNSLVIIAGTWSKEKMEQIKNLKSIEDFANIKDNDQITYLMLDGLYRRILKEAQDTDQIEYTESIFNPLEGTPNP